MIASRPWTTSPPTTGGLATGAKAMCEEFPRVWSAAKGQLHVAVNGSWSAKIPSEYLVKSMIQKILKTLELYCVLILTGNGLFMCRK